MDDTQLLSAKISQRTNLIILPFVIAHMLVGIMSEYEQNLPLYGIFSIPNGITGGLVFFLHCSNNQQVGYITHSTTMAYYVKEYYIF
ncbi:UNVERIFIED_CONTAM: hypothetical protein GTU68_021001 [Idotea baltica]|nr:hypothetical protein [Idotea baltica]